MVKDKTPCDINALGQFFDRELEPDASVAINEHIEHCHTCREELQGNQFVSSLLKAAVEEEISQANLQEVEERLLTVIRAKKGPWWIQFKGLCLSKKFYVPAAAMAAALIMFFHVISVPVPTSGPSAIIDSLQGNFASVMILETQKSRQTILWIHEASDRWDNNGDTTDQTGLRPFSTKYCLGIEKDRVGWQETDIDRINTC